MRLAPTSVAPVTPGAAPATPVASVHGPAAPGTPLGERSPGVAQLCVSFVERQRAGLRRDHTALVRLCLAEGTDWVNKSSVGRFTSSIWSQPSAKDRVGVFTRLLSLGMWRELPKRGHMACPCVPVIETLQSFTSALPETDVFDVSAGLPESISAQAVHAFLGEDGRADNDATMLTYLSGMSRGDRGRGRLQKEREDAVKEWQTRHTKMSDHVQSVNLLRKWARERAGSRNATSPPSFQPDQATLTPVYAHAVESLGRLYAQVLSFQCLPRRVRSAVRGVDVEDWDMANCMFTVTVQLVARLGLSLDAPQADLATWSRYAADPGAVRDLVAVEFGACAKDVLLKAANGGTVPPTGNPGVDEVLQGLSSEARVLRWLAATVVSVGSPPVCCRTPSTVSCRIRRSTHGQRIQFSTICGPLLRTVA